jgi:hypothetical protein
MRKVICLAILCCFRSALPGQIPLEWSAGLQYGAIWRHSPKLSTQTGEGLHGFELGFRYQTTGRRLWHGWQRYPAFGLNIAQQQLGQGSHGQARSILPYLVIPITGKGGFSTYFQVGSGLAWVRRPYDSSSNPTQNAISSRWNNITQFRLGAALPLWQQRYLLQVGASLSHFSNGGGKLPNFGINIPSGFCALVWRPRALPRSAYLPPPPSRKVATRRWGLLAQSGLALVEYSAVDGPKYPVWVGTLSGFFRLNTVNRLHLGVEWERNGAVEAFGRHTYLFADERQARLGASRLSLLVADEFLFGPLGISVQMGHYIGGPARNQLVLRRYYSRLGLRYFLPAIPRTNGLRPFLGVSLKAHGSVADYMGWNLGLMF